MSLALIIYPNRPSQNENRNPPSSPKRDYGATSPPKSDISIIARPCAPGGRSAAVPATAREQSSPHPKKSHAVRPGKAAGEDTRAPVAHSTGTPCGIRNVVAADVSRLKLAPAGIMNGFIPPCGTATIFSFPRARPSAHGVPLPPPHRSWPDASYPGKGQHRPAIPRSRNRD